MRCEQVSLAVLATMVLTGSSALSQTGSPLTLPRGTRTDTSVVHLPVEVIDRTGATATLVIVKKVKAEASIFADGNIRQAISEAAGQTTAELTDEEKNKNAASARLGVSYRDVVAQTQWTGMIAVASTLKRVENNHVATVLVPGVGDGFHSALIEYRGYGRNWFTEHSHVYLTAASSDWAFNDTTVNAVLLGGAALRVFPLARPKVLDIELGMSLEVGPSVRLIHGDITLERNKPLMRRAIGTTDEFFVGLETGLQLQVGAVTANFHLYNYLNHNEDVPGLTHAQVVASINARGPIYTGKIYEEDDD